MICQACAKEGKTSRLTSLGRTATLLAWRPYWDEGGAHHAHDPNRNREAYRCSEGHAFERIFWQPCPAGDYPAPDTDEIVLSSNEGV